MREQRSLALLLVHHVLRLLLTEGLVPTSRLLVEATPAETAIEHRRLYYFLLFLLKLKLLLGLFTASNFFHGESEGHRLLFPQRHHLLLRVGLGFWHISYVNWQLLFFFSRVICSLATIRCLAELNSFRLLMKIFLQIFSCLFKEVSTKLLPHYLHGKRSCLTSAMNDGWRSLDSFLSCLKGGSRTDFTG